MARRILTHTLAALGGAVLAAAAFYGLLMLGWFASPPAPRGELEVAKAALRDRLRDACGEDAARGAFVNGVEEQGDQLLIVGTFDREGQQKTLIDVATKALESNEEEWGRFFKRRPPITELAAYPLRSKLLPELRKLLEVGGQGVPTELVGRVWIEDAYCDARGKLRVFGVAIVSADVKPGDARSQVKEVIAAFLRRNLPPNGTAIEPVVNEDDFRVAGGVRQKLTAAVAGRGASVWSLSLDGAGVPVVKVLRKPTDRAEGLLADLMPVLTAAGLFPSGEKMTLVEVVADNKTLAAELQKKLASGEDRLGQQTRLDSVEVDAGNNTLVVACKGICAHEGKDNLDPLRQILTRLLADEWKVKAADLAIKLDVRPRPDLLGDARELLLKESKTSELRRVRLTGLRFDPAGRLVLESPSAPPLVEKVRALAERELLKAEPSAVDEQEEFVAVYADPPATEDGLPKARRLLAKNAELRYFRLDGAAEDRSGKLFFTGVSIAPLDGKEKDKGIAIRITPALTEAGYTLAGDLLMPSKATLNDKAVKENAYYKEFPNPVGAFQKRIDGAKGMEGVLLFDAYYQAEGKLRLIGIIQREEQVGALKTLLEKPGADVDPLVLRGKGIPSSGEGLELKDKDAKGEGLNLSGLAVANLDLRAECQKVLAAPTNELLLRHTRIDRVVWERGKDPNTVKVNIVGFCFHPAEGKEGAVERTKSLKAALAGAVEGRIKTLNEVLKPKGFAIPIPPVDNFNLGEFVERGMAVKGMQYADKTFERRLIERVLEDQADKARDEGVSVKGVVVTGTDFDAVGKLRIAGLVVSKAQAEELTRLAASHFLAPSDEKDWQTKDAPPLVMDVTGLKEYDNVKLASAIQTALADPKSAADVRRVRVDRAWCEYKKAKDLPPQLVLRVSGIYLGKAAKPHPARAIVLEAVKYLKELPSLTDTDLQMDLAEQTLPLAAFQKKVAADPALDGTLLTDVGYDTEGRFLVRGLSPATKEHAPLLRDAVKACADPIILQPAGTKRDPDEKLDALTWKDTVNTWPGMLSAIQAKLAADPVKGEPVLSQSRIDRAYFVHDGNPASAELRFAGLSLYAVRRDRDARRKKQFIAALPDNKTGPLFREADFHDGYLGPLAKAIEAEVGKLLPAPSFTTSVAGVRLRISPIQEAHNAANTALKRLPGATRRTHIEGFYFDAAGDLVPVVKFDTGKEVEATAGPAIQKAIEDADKEELAKTDPKLIVPPLLRKGAKVRWPSGAKTAGPKKEFEVRADAEGTPYLRLRQAMRERLALKESGPVANSAWVAGLDIMDDGVNPPSIRLQGFLLSPAPLAQKAVADALDPLRGDYRIDASGSKHEPRALERIQAALSDARIDGVVFRRARYTAGGELQLVLAVNDVEQRKPVEAKLTDEKASLLDPILVEGKSWKVIPQPGLKKWSDLVEETTRSFLREDASSDGMLFPLGRYTRLDRAGLRLGKTWDDVELRWEAVCIYPGNRTETDIKNETRRRLMDSATSVVLSGATCVLEEGEKTGTTVLTNPKYHWQRGVSGDSLPANDGILFEDAWYDEGKLKIDVSIAKDTPEKELAQKEVARKRVEEEDVDRRVFAPAWKKQDKPRPDFPRPPFDLRASFEQIRSYVRKSPDLDARVRKSDSPLDSRFRVDRGYFLYPTTRGQVEFHLSGLLLQRTPPTGKSLTLEEREQLKAEVDAVRGIIDKTGKELTVSNRAGTVVVVSQLTPLVNLARYLQSAIKDYHKPDGVYPLDGVCLLDARFDADRLRLRGKWADKGQGPELLDVCRVLIDRKYPNTIDPKSIRLDCDEFASNKILAALEKYAADSLDETIVDRLFFDEFGLVSVSARSPSPTVDKGKLEKRLGELLAALAGSPVKGRLSIDPTTDAVVFVVASPKVDVTSLESIVGPLRAEVQRPAKGPAKGPDPKWDGMLIVRCYYTPAGKFGVQGLCDSDGQRKAFAALLDDLSERGPFRKPLGKGFQVTRLRAAPLAPLLAHLRRQLSSEEDFDGLSIVGAGQDVNGRLLLDVDLVGPLPPARQAKAETLAFGVVAKKVESAERVGGGLGLVIRSRTARDPNLAEAAIRRATSDFALALSQCPPGGPKWRPAGIPPQDYFAVTVAQLDKARLHVPNDSTLWYLRAMVNVWLEDDEAAERDARRAQRIEADRITGKAMRLRRLELLERVQGEVRRITDGLMRKARIVIPGR